jgi:hypothetical protein
MARQASAHDSESGLSGTSRKRTGSDVRAGSFTAQNENPIPASMVAPLPGLPPSPPPSTAPEAIYIPARMLASDLPIFQPLPPPSTVPQAMIVTCSPATAFQSAPELPERPATYHEITFTPPLVHDQLASRRLSKSPPTRRPLQTPTPLRETSLSETPSSSFDTYNLAPVGQDPSSLVQGMDVGIPEPLQATHEPSTGMDAGFLKSLQATDFAAIAELIGPVPDPVDVDILETLQAGRYIFCSSD